MNKKNLEGATKGLDPFSALKHPELKRTKHGFQAVLGSQTMRQRINLPIMRNTGL
jgi:hypothetical protein